MKATTEEQKKPDVIITLSWEEAKAISNYLGILHIAGDIYNLFCIVTDIVEDGKMESTQ